MDSVTHSSSSLPLIRCQYTAGHELVQMSQVPQMAAGATQLAHTLSPSSTVLQQSNMDNIQPLTGTNVHTSSTTSMTNIPTAISSSFQGYAVSVSGHLNSIPIGQVSAIQSVATHGPTNAISYNSG